MTNWARCILWRIRMIGLSCLIKNRSSLRLWSLSYHKILIYHFLSFTIQPTLRVVKKTVITNYVIEINLLSSLDRGFIRENYLQAVWPTTLTFNPNQLWNRLVGNILYPMRKADLVHLHTLFDTLQRIKQFIIEFYRKFAAMALHGE